MNKYKSIEEFLSDQTADKLQEINKLRELILHTEPRLVENLKWNAPNYVYNDEDRITFNVINKQNKVKIVIHMGPTRKENKKGSPLLPNDQGLVEWNSDIRGTISFEDIHDVNTKSTRLQKLFRDWLALN